MKPTLTVPARPRMMSTASQSLPELDELVALFYGDAAELGQFERVSALVVPEPFRHLLAHNAHMTVTVEDFHGCKVDVSVLQTRKEGDHYSRKSCSRGNRMRQ